MANCRKVFMRRILFAVLASTTLLAVAPSTAVYGELLSARSFAGTLLGRSAPRQA